MCEMIQLKMLDLSKGIKTAFLRQKSGFFIELRSCTFFSTSNFPISYIFFISIPTTPNFSWESGE